MQYITVHELPARESFSQVCARVCLPLLFNARVFAIVIHYQRTTPLQALEAWESTVFNLGHCHRKLGNLDKAASCYLRARELSPQRHSVHSALALTHHLQVATAVLYVRRRESACIYVMPVFVVSTLFGPRVFHDRSSASASPGRAMVSQHARTHAGAHTTPNHSRTEATVTHLKRSSHAVVLAPSPP